MIISLCGNSELKEKFIKTIKEIYNDKVLVCDVFHIKFNVIIETEKIKYKLLAELKNIEIARKEYQKIVYEKSNNKINKIINENKDKIILLLDKDILTFDFTESIYFKQSDIKILFEDIIDNYDKCKFDYVLNRVKDIDIKKLVKL